ncbi:MAG TPA: hypothetical protein VGK72_04060 [Chthoniobacterales bacterium]
MKLIRTFLLTVACSFSLGALPFALAEPEPTATPHEEPSGTPHEEPSATPNQDPGDNHDGDDGDDDQGDDDGGEVEHGGLSLRGLYEGTTATGALAVLYVESNTHVQINILDTTGQEIDFAEGLLSNGTFAFTLTNGQAIAGNANENSIAVTLGDQMFTAEHVETFGATAAAGRYVGVVQGVAAGTTVMFIIDAQNNIVMVENAAGVRTGGYGTVTVPADGSTTYSFTLDHSIGSSTPITGTFTIVDGVFSGSFTTSDGTFTVTSFKESLANRMANISTRGLVGPGQGQLIGGFIITGGPKTVIIRAIGPSLTAAGVSPAAADPALQLFAGSTALAANDDWGTNANAAQITASGLAPQDAKEAALLVRLEPGQYTTVVTNNDGSTAIALVEVYEMAGD